MCGAGNPGWADRGVRAQPVRAGGNGIQESDASFRIGGQDRADAGERHRGPLLVRLDLGKSFCRERAALLGAPPHPVADLDRKESAGTALRAVATRPGPDAPYHALTITAAKKLR
jgi:hypothetical protein